MEAYKVVAPKTVDQVVAWEIETTYTTETRVWAAGVPVTEIGQVYGVVTANGTIKPHDVANNDGSEIAAGVALNRGVAGENCAGLENGPAIVFVEGLIFKAGISAPNKAAALAALRAKLIKAR